jgi:molybdopterin-guanine dinucleotide biosynthesis protein A
MDASKDGTTPTKRASALSSIKSLGPETVFILNYDYPAVMPKIKSNLLANFSSRKLSMKNTKPTLQPSDFKGIQGK